MQEVSITTEGIQKNLKNFKPLDALCEYIWNGFDAQADRVDVKLHTNEFGLINMISIVDNGTGIAYEELGDKFKPFNDSKKYDSSNNDFLYKFRRQYLKEASDKFIDKLIDSKIYPEFNESNPIDTYRKSELDNLVGTLYVAQPKIFTNLSDDNKKITISLLKLIMDAEDKDNLFKVLKQVVDLEEDELAELAGVLKYTSLSNITRLVKMIEDRQMVIQGLKELVFNKEMYAKEVPHIQSIVGNHYWLFGEQYNLITAAEPDFTLALKGLILATTGKEEDVDIDHEDKNKEMNIFMIR